MQLIVTGKQNGRAVSFKQASLTPRSKKPESFKVKGSMRSTSSTLRVVPTGHTSSLHASLGQHHRLTIVPWLLAAWGNASSKKGWD